MKTREGPLDPKSDQLSVRANAADAVSNSRLPPGTPLVLLIAVPLLFVLLFGLSMGKHLDHDEHQFVVSGALLARYGSLPYRDYPYFHMPNQVFIFAALYCLGSHLLLLARSFNVLCSTCTLAILLVLALRLFSRVGIRASRWAALGLAAGVIFNLVYAFTSGKAWNHDLPVLLTLLALLALWEWRQAQGGAALAWIAASGALFGLAVGTRLTFAPCGAAFLASMRVGSPKTRRASLAAIACFSAGALVALAPSFWFLATAPRQFIFGNFRYPALNTAYRRQEGYAKSMTALGKLAWTFKDLFIRPGNLLLAIAAGASLVAFRRKPGEAPHPHWYEMFSLALLVGTLLIGSFAPAPLWWPYFFAPVPFMALFVLYVADDPRKTVAQASSWWKTLAMFVIVTVVCGIPKYFETAPAMIPGRWMPVRLHRQGQEIAARCRGGPVLTLAPLLPMEGGCAIYEPWATGPFALRVGGMIREEEEGLLKQVDAEDLGEMLAGRPPAGVLLGFEEGMELPLRSWAERRHYASARLKSRGDNSTRAPVLMVSPVPASGRQPARRELSSHRAHSRHRDRTTSPGRGP